MSVKDDCGSPLIPGIKGITEKVAERLECVESFQEVIKHFEIDDRPPPNVEDLLTHIRSLHAVAGNDKARGLTAMDLTYLDEQICSLIHEIVDVKLPSNDSPYHKLARWTKAITREYPIEIFTTNYDLLIESAYEDLSEPYFDGFAGSINPRFDLRAMEEDELPARWSRIWKLHGSINWYQDRDVVYRLIGGKNTRVIYPSHLKYEESRRLPYLAIMDRLRAFLSKPNAVLVISGYSFGDQHINEVILQGLRAAPTSITFGILFETLTDNPVAVDLATDHPNLALWGAEGAVIGQTKGEWSVSGPTDDEQMTNIIEFKYEDDDQDTVAVDRMRLGDFAVMGEYLDEIVGLGRG